MKKNAYWIGVGIWILFGIFLPFLVPLPLGTLVYTSSMLSFAELHDTLSSEKIPSELFITLQAEKLAEKSISPHEVYTALAPLFNNTEEVFGELSSSRFRIPIEKKTYRSKEQLQFFPITSSVILADIATLEYLPIDSLEPAQFFSKNTGQWHEAFTEKVSTSVAFLPYAKWAAWNNAEKKIEGKPITMQWFYENTSIFLWWQYIALFIGFSLFLFFKKNIDTKALPEDRLCIQGVSIARAKIISGYTFSLPRSVVWLFAVFGSVFVWTIEYAPLYAVPTNTFSLEQHSLSSQFFTEAQQVMQENTLFDALFFENTLFIAKNNFLFSGLFDGKIVAQTPEEAKEIMKYVSVFDKLPAVWEKTSAEKTLILPNFSAIREYKISSEEVGTFFQMLGNPLFFGNIGLQLQGGMGTDFTQWKLKSHDNMMISAKELFIVNPVLTETGAQTIRISVQSIWQYIQITMHGLSLQFIFLDRLLWLFLCAVSGFITVISFVLMVFSGAKQLLTQQADRKKRAVQQPK